MSRNENKPSIKGVKMPHAKDTTVRHEEYAGSHGSDGVSFKMPSDAQCTDHSKVRTPEHK
jgi:hypothetical protein